MCPYSGDERRIAGGGEPCCSDLTEAKKVLFEKVDRLETASNKGKGSMIILAWLFGALLMFLGWVGIQSSQVVTQQAVLTADFGNLKESVNKDIGGLKRQVSYLEKKVK